MMETLSSKNALTLPLHPRLSGIPLPVRQKRLSGEVGVGGVSSKTLC